MTRQNRRGRIPTAARTAVLLLGLLAASCAQTAAPSRATAAADARTADAVLGQPAPDGLSDLAVSCPSVRRCWAVGWRAPGTSAEGGAAAGPVIVATTDGGARWRVQLGNGRTPGPGPTASLNAVSCPDDANCMAVGDTDAPQLTGMVFVLRDRERSWTTATTPAGVADLVGVQCSTPGTCTALATNGTGSGYFSVSTLDDGATWQRGGALPASFGGAGGLACDAGRCLVAGYTTTTVGHGSGAIALSTDGGATWSLATVPAGSGVLHAVSCAAPTCLAVGTTSTVTTGVSPGHGLVLASADGGATFVARPTPSGLDDGMAVSCPEPSVCAAVGTKWTRTIPASPLSGVVTTGDLGDRFTAPEQRFVPSPLVAVSCQPTACVAAGWSVLAGFALPPPLRLAARRSSSRGAGAATVPPRTPAAGA